jgi:hypothetical protein
MTLEIGFCELKIKEHTIREAAGKEVIDIICENAAGETINATIWLTAKAFGIARKSLKVIGFDVDSRKLAELLDTPKLLAGNKFPAEIEEYRGELRANVRIGADPPKKTRLEELEAGLRAAKKGNAATDEDIPF